MLISDLSSDDLQNELNDVIGSSLSPSFSLENDIIGRIDDVTSDIEGFSEEEAPDSRTVSKILNTLEDIKNDYKEMVLNSFESAMQIAGRYYPEVKPNFEEWVHRKSVLGVTSETLNIVLSSFKFNDLKEVLPSFFKNRSAMNSSSFEDLAKTMLSFSRRGYGINKGVPFSSWIDLIDDTLYQKDPDLFKKQINLPSILVSFGVFSPKDFESAMGLFVKSWPSKDSLSSFQESGIKKIVTNWLQINVPKAKEERFETLKAINLELFSEKSDALSVVKESFVEAVQKYCTPEQKSDFEKILLSKRSIKAPVVNQPKAL